MEAGSGVEAVVKKLKDWWLGGDPECDCHTKYVCNVPILYRERARAQAVAHNISIILQSLIRENPPGPKCKAGHDTLRE